MSNLRPCAYDYNIEQAYEKLAHLTQSVVLLRGYTQPEVYTCGKLTGVKVI